MTSLSPERLAEIRAEYEGYDRDVKLGRILGTPTVGEFLDLLAALDTHVWKPTHDTCIACQGTIKPTWVCQGCGSVGAVLEDVEPGIQAACESATVKEATP